MTLGENKSKLFGIICDVGGKYKGNQDSVFYSDFNIVFAPASPKSKSLNFKGILALVADGVSGSNHGEEGSTFVVQKFSSLFFQMMMEEIFQLEKMKQKISDLILKTNELLLQQFSTYIQEGKIPKSTLVGMVIIGQWLWVFNLGDSRGFIIRDDFIEQITKDHIGTTTLHEITQAMGQTPLEPEVKVFNWAFENKQHPNELSYKHSCYALICSDGLTDKVSAEEILTTISNDGKDRSLQEKIQKLFYISLDRKIDDNVSIIAINLSQYFSSLTNIQILQLNP